MKTIKRNYALCKAYLSAINFVKSLTHVTRLHLGTRVMYHGREMYISNACYYNKFQLRDVNDRAHYGQPVYANTNDVNMVRDFDNVWHNATYLWHWYKQTWLSIDSRLMSEGQKVNARF